MMEKFHLFSIVLLLTSGSLLIEESSCGVIKDLFQKITHTNNKTEDVVKQSAPICGSGAFSTPNEASLSPEIIFISNRPSRVVGGSGEDYERSSSSDQQQRRRDNAEGGQGGRVAEVADEYSFHMENVTLRDLERRGFSRDAPVTFLMHGFTSGYPKQAWISAIVEAYTIDRATKPGEQSNQGDYGNSDYDNQQERRRRPNSDSDSNLNSDLNGSSHSAPAHNLFIVNWNYAARGILYPRAVANIPIVASYVTRFINDKLLREARIEPDRIQLIGHSLGAHLAGFIGKNTDQKLGRIYGLDPAGPCFGSLSGPLYPSSKRLAPSDAKEVITVQTNSALLGIDKPLGRYSIFVEGGASQPGCKGGGVLKSLHTLTWDGADFDALACSHSRSPNLLTYRHDQSDHEDDCQLVAYACKDWDSFLAGHCGVCEQQQSATRRLGASSAGNPMQSVECKRIGLDWQYYNNKKTNKNTGSSSWHKNEREHLHYNGSSNGFEADQYENSPNYQRRRPKQQARNRRDFQENSTSSVSPEERAVEERRRGSRDTDVEPISMFIRTGDTQPYCSFHYQIILELNERFPGRSKPPMAIILQDSESTGEGKPRNTSPGQRRAEQNSLSSDEFGNKFDERIYTHLLTSSKKLKRIDHGTLIFRNGLEDGHRLFKSLHVNYMSHADPKVRARLSSRLCPVKTETDRSRQNNQSNRFYFKPCESLESSSSSSYHEHDNHDHYQSNNHQHNYSNNNSNNGYDQSSSTSNQNHGHNEDSHNYRNHSSYGAFN